MKQKHKILLTEQIPKKKCRYCYSTENLTYDHKIPKILGGSDKPGNIQVLCRRCNGLKSQMTNKQVRNMARWIYEINQKRQMNGKGPMGIKKSLVDL